MRIVGLDVLEVQFPFRISFGHALASRSSSRNVIVAARTEDGLGWALRYGIAPAVTHLATGGERV